MPNQGMWPKSYSSTSTYHHLSAAEAVSVRQTSTLRKRPVGKAEVKQKDYHKPRRCPVQNCSAVVKRLSADLRTHKILQHSAEYEELLATTRTRPRSVGMMHDSSNALPPIIATSYTQDSEVQAQQMPSV